MPVLCSPPTMTAPLPLPPALRGLLHLYANDLDRLQRLVDPLLATALFAVVVAPQTPGLSGVTTILVGCLTALMLPQGRLYQSYRQASLLTLFRRLTVSWLLVLSTLFSLAFAAKVSDSFSRLAVFGWALVYWLFLILLHVGGRKLLRWHRIRGGNARTIVYWGLPASAIAFHRKLTLCPYLGLRMLAWFSPQDPAGLSLPDGMPPCGGQLGDLRRWLDHNAPDQIVFSYLSRNDLSMTDLIRFFGDTCVPVVYAPTWSTPGMQFQVEEIGDQPCIDLWRPQDSLLDRQLKRTFDLAVAGFALTVLTPLLLSLALAIRLTSPGPVLFLQDRYGMDGRRFRIYKFRSMRVVEAGDQVGLRQATRDASLEP